MKKYFFILSSLAVFSASNYLHASTSDSLPKDIVCSYYAEHGFGPSSIKQTLSFKDMINQKETELIFPDYPESAKVRFVSPDQNPEHFYAVLSIYKNYAPDGGADIKTWRFDLDTLIINSHRQKIAFDLYGQTRALTCDFLNWGSNHSD